MAKLPFDDLSGGVISAGEFAEKIADRAIPRYKAPVLKSTEQPPPKAPAKRKKKK